jgi:alkanesulfonate monooxygenase SsuD/methylene tetrahydromethanopterin reductase-like flavin-dependent oxidoreductase (luciferase family)
MRVGMTIFCQNAEDWDRYEAAERGEDAAARPATSDRSIFLEEVDFARQADKMGFDTVWTVEHHFTPYTMVPNPLQLLTYLAGVTENVDLGTMVVVLPWHNPVQVAEDAIMLDTLLGDRRLILGVGRGLGRREFAGLNVDQNEARGRFDESVQIVRELLRTGEIREFKGQYYPLKDLKIRPQPEQDLSDLLYCAAGSPETMEIIAKFGIKPMIVPNTDLKTALAGLHHYVDVREESGFGPVDTRLALWTYCHEDEDEARATAEEHIAEYADTAIRHYELMGDHLKDIKGYEAYGQRSGAMQDDRSAFARGIIDGHPWGTPEQIIEKTKVLAEAFGTSEITFIFRYGTMPIEKAQKSIELFSKEVLPALKELNPAPLQSAKATAAGG